MKHYSALEVIGPKMIGPSSSHTAGAARLGLIAHALLHDDIERVVFYLHGSFAKTYRGHGTDRALMAGILGIRQDDENLRYSLDIAQSRGIAYCFEEANLGNVHPNTVKFVITQKDGVVLELMGSSIGGAHVKVIEINGMKIELNGQYPTLITRHLDHPGVVSKITKILAKHQINIAYMSVFRQDRGEEALMVIESDNRLEESLIQTIFNASDEIKEVFIINSL